jgi:carbamoyl-phosphate synthase small subunit
MQGTKSQKVTLVLQDKSIYSGYSFGSAKSVAGEVVFNTGMVGYPEAMTDPSYKGQILVLTYPMIGNYGVPSDEIKDGMLKNFESSKIQVSGLIVLDYCEDYNHWNAVRSLSDWMDSQGIPGIYGVDTREITKKLRSEGVMLGKIVNKYDVKFYDPNKDNLVDLVSCKKPIVYGSNGKKILLIDCGVKNNIIRCFLKRGCVVKRVPWNYDFTNEDYDGLFISNGPGDPKMADVTIDNLRKALTGTKPIFGICLGSQLLALAAGADTFKLKFGHRSQNQPCVEVGTKRCYITTQNHGFAVKSGSLPSGWVSWFENVNDKTNEGIRHYKKPFLSVQFHPEHHCGPTDTEFLFDKFLGMIE